MLQSLLERPPPLLNKKGLLLAGNSSSKTKTGSQSSKLPSHSSSSPTNISGSPSRYCNWHLRRRQLSAPSFLHLLLTHFIRGALLKTTNEFVGNDPNKTPKVRAGFDRHTLYVQPPRDGYLAIRVRAAGEAARNNMIEFRIDWWQHIVSVIAEEVTTTCPFTLAVSPTKCHIELLPLNDLDHAFGLYIQHLDHQQQTRILFVALGLLIGSVSRKEQHCKMITPPGWLARAWDDDERLAQFKPMVQQLPVVIPGQLPCHY